MKIVLNTELVRAIEDKGALTVYIRMADGRWAVQRPYAADLRGQIGALTLAIDALAGKIILQDAVHMDERAWARGGQAPGEPVAGLLNASNGPVIEVKRQA